MCLQGNEIMGQIQVSGIDIDIEQKVNDDDLVVKKVNCLCWLLC